MPKINGKTWNDIRTVPRSTTVTLKTVKGIVCKGKVLKSAKLMKKDRYGDRRIPAKRIDLKTCVEGDIRAVAWR